MPETIDGRLSHSLFAIRHTSYAFPGLDFSRRIPRRAAFCILRADELSSLGGVLQCAGLQTVQLHERGSQHGTSHDHGREDLGRTCGA